jgi:hypothetical protein
VEGLVVLLLVQPPLELMVGAELLAEMELVVLAEAVVGELAVVLVHMGLMVWTRR